MAEVSDMNWNPFRLRFLDGREWPDSQGQSAQTPGSEAATPAADATPAAGHGEAGPFSRVVRGESEPAPVAELEAFKAARARMEARLRDLGKLRNRSVA
jgi:hypothetical protein